MSQSKVYEVGEDGQVFVVTHEDRHYLCLYLEEGYIIYERMPDEIEQHQVHQIVCDHLGVE